MPASSKLRSPDPYGSRSPILMKTSLPDRMLRISS